MESVVALLRFVGCLVLCVWSSIAVSDASRIRLDSKIRIPTEESSGSGTKWAVLVAGSSGFSNYRHQADICHAYQILKRGGLKDENIVVFMYDDIAHNYLNPRPGVIINNPEGEDVYAGVPKDYTGDNVNVENLFAVILGDKDSVKGGSGKVVNSGPDDLIFIYYSDHGGAGVLGMPSGRELYADELLKVLKKKHAAGTYKKMVIYLEACESGSIFEGLLPKGWNIYVTTASNAQESSWGTYCPGTNPAPPVEYSTCLGDLYSVAWMEDSEVHNTFKETLEDQYLVVEERTSQGHSYQMGSHVMQYGDKNISAEALSTYIGFDQANANATFDDRLTHYMKLKHTGAVDQRDADLIFLWQKYIKSKSNSIEKSEAQQELVRTLSKRMHLDRSVELMGKLLYGAETGPSVLQAVRPRGQPVTDDWVCLRKLVRTFESYCGALSQYGMKHMRAFANICNSGVSAETVDTVTAEACARSFNWNSNAADHSIM